MSIRVTPFDNPMNVLPPIQPQYQPQSYPNQAVAPTETSAKKSNAYIMFLLLAVIILIIGLYLYYLQDSEVIELDKIYCYIIIGISILTFIASIIIGSTGGPATPTNVTVANGDGKVIVSFTGSKNCLFTVRSSSGSNTTGNASPITVNGLTNGTAYIFTVTASNFFGTSKSSLPSASITPVQLPKTPTGISAVPRNSSAIVSFTPNGTFATSFRATSSPGNISATGTSSPITVTGLTNGTAYTFTVVGIASTGSSDPSSPSNSVTPVAIPAAPTSVSAIPGSTSACIFFTPSTNATSYTVTPFISTTAGQTITGTSSPIIVTNLTNDSIYTFSITATNGSGTSASSQASDPITPLNTLATFISLNSTVNLLGKKLFITNNTGVTLPSFNVKLNAQSNSLAVPCNIVPAGWTAISGGYLPLGNTTRSVANGANVFIQFPSSFSSFCTQTPATSQTFTSLSLYNSNTMGFSVTLNQSGNNFTFNSVTGTSNTWFNGYTLSYL